MGQTYSPQGVTLRISPSAPFKVLAAFPTPKTTPTGCTGGSGLAVGPANQLLLGCGGTSTSSLIISDKFDGTAILGAQAGPDEEV